MRACGAALAAAAIAVLTLDLVRGDATRAYAGFGMPF